MNNFKHQQQASIEKLVKLNANLYLNFLVEEPNQLTDTEIQNLLGLASILSLSENSSDISNAYEICSRLVEVLGKENKNIVASTDIILSRIGNFPGRQLLRKKYNGGQLPRANLHLALERIAREAENSIEENTQLTDFQYRLYQSLKGQECLSVSAPTSAGKSFILNLDIIRRINESDGKCIVYIVPTRALVAEVSSRVRSTTREEGLENVIVRTAPFPIKYDVQPKGIIFILTQERLIRLLTNEEHKERVDLLIVDEAHEIQKGKRGVILQNAIDIAIRKNPDIKIFFASPLISNPGYFLSLFNLSRNGEFFIEEVSPVSQNIFLISEVKGSPKSANITLLSGITEIDVGIANLDFSFRKSNIKLKAHFAKSICKKDESTIIFADSASIAEKIAEELTSTFNDIVMNEEVNDFIDFIKSEIHEEYPLVNCLRKGVAFHYGDMPSIIRTGVEKLFRENRIRFLCCTSTLLQGVNLPAKHIIIENPHLGETPMSRADFRNLSGRAGRLLKEFHGNIWCLNPNKWDEKSFSGNNLQEISGAMNNAMEDGGTLINAVFNSTVNKNDRDFAETIFSRLYHELKNTEYPNSKVKQSYETSSNKEILDSNITKLLELEVIVPKDILEAHMSLRPDSLNKLLLSIKRHEHIESLILLSPYEQHAKARMINVINIIRSAFEKEIDEKYGNWINNVAYNWAFGTPISKLISERIKFKKSQSQNVSTSSIIRALLKLIEKEIRYTLVRYFSAFEDLLKYELNSRKELSLSNQIAPYHIFLEYGSCNPACLSLMALGLSRFTAIKLNNVIQWGVVREPEDYLAKIMTLDRLKLGLPKVCEAEIKELIGVI